MRLNKELILVILIVTVLIGVSASLTRSTNSVGHIEIASNPDSSLPFKNTIKMPGTSLVICSPIELTAVNDFKNKQELMNYAKESYGWEAARRNIMVSVIYVRFNSDLVDVQKLSSKTYLLSGIENLKRQVPHSEVTSFATKKINEIDAAQARVKLTTQSMDTIKQDFLVIKQDKMWIIETEYKGYNAKEGDALTSQIFNTVELY